jgi:hypothetical protein
LTTDAPLVPIRQMPVPSTFEPLPTSDPVAGNVTEAPSTTPTTNSAISSILCPSIPPAAPPLVASPLPLLGLRSSPDCNADIDLMLKNPSPSMDHSHPIAAPIVGFVPSPSSASLTECVVPNTDSQSEKPPLLSQTRFSQPLTIPAGFSSQVDFTESEKQTTVNKNKRSKESQVHAGDPPCDNQFKSAKTDDTPNLTSRPLSDRPCPSPADHVIYREGPYTREIDGRYSHINGACCLECGCQVVGGSTPTGQTVDAREIVPTKDSPVWVCSSCQQNLICHSCFVPRMVVFNAAHPGKLQRVRRPPSKG